MNGDDDGYSGHDDQMLYDKKENRVLIEHFDAYCYPQLQLGQG